MKTILFILAFALPVSAFGQSVDGKVLEVKKYNDTIEIEAYCTNNTGRAYWGITNPYPFNIEVEYGLTHNSNGKPLSYIGKKTIPEGQTIKFHLPQSPRQPYLVARAIDYKDSDTDVNNTYVYRQQITSVCQNDLFDVGKSYLESPAMGLMLTEAAQKKLDSGKKVVEDTLNQSKIAEMQKQIEMLIQLIQLLTASKGLQ